MQQDVLKYKNKKTASCILQNAASFVYLRLF